MKALFVCTANSCRSVMAEFLFNHYSGKEKNGWEAKSCGIAAERYYKTPDGVKKALARLGIADVEHTPQLTSRVLASWATDIFAMTKEHKEVLDGFYPEHHKKIHLFMEYAGLGPNDVSDPIGKPVEQYYQCCDIIEQGVKGIFSHANIAEPPRP